MRYRLKILSALSAWAFTSAWADPAQLPAGWQVSPAQYGMSTVSIPGSDDMVIIGVLATGDTDKVVTTLAEQATAAYTIEKPWPITKSANGITQGGATLRFTDGRVAGNFVFAAPLANGTTALTSIITANVQDQESLLARMREVGGVMKQLRDGASVPSPSVMTNDPPMPDMPAPDMTMPDMTPPDMMAPETPPTESPASRQKQPLRKTEHKAEKLAVAKAAVPPKRPVRRQPKPATPSVVAASKIKATPVSSAGQQN
jgi:hypothetical protein